MQYHIRFCHYVPLVLHYVLRFHFALYVIKLCHTISYCLYSVTFYINQTFPLFACSLKPEKQGPSVSVPVFSLAVGKHWNHGPKTRILRLGAGLGGCKQKQGPAGERVTASTRPLLRTVRLSFFALALPITAVTSPLASILAKCCKSADFWMPPELSILKRSKVAAPPSRGPRPLSVVSLESPKRRLTSTTKTIDYVGCPSTISIPGLVMRTQLMMVVVVSGIDARGRSGYARIL